MQHFDPAVNCGGCRTNWTVEDKNGEIKYNIQDDSCCNANCCAPSLCCPVRKLHIFDASGKNEVGALYDYFPGCGLRGCFGTADNFRLVFPDNATPEMKTALVSAVVLIDMMLFEKKEDNNNKNGCL
jgi:hypothetical protein